MSYTPRHAKPSPLKRRAAALAAGIGIAASLLAPQASAQEIPAPLSSTTGVDAFLQQVQTQYSSLGSSNNPGTRDAALNMRNTLRQQADGLAIFGPQVPAQAKASIDQTVEALFPGLIAERTPRPAPAPAAPAPAPAQPAFDYGSCPKDAKACIDLKGQRSWLQNNGQVYYGAVRISSGKPGYETPRGTHYVSRKVKDEVSYIYNMAPMPYSVYFTNNGIAFHGGDPYVMSHGCIHLYNQDAAKYFNDLKIGDKVYVY